MLTERPIPPHRIATPRSQVRELRTALRQLDAYVARMSDPADEQILAAAAALLGGPVDPAPRDVAA